MYSYETLCFMSLDGQSLNPLYDKEKKHCLTAQSSVFSTVNTWLQKGSINSRLTRPKFKTPGLKHLYTDLIKSVPLKPDGAFDDKVNGTAPTLGLRR